MPILSGTNNPLFTTSTSIQNVLDAVAQDIRQQLSSAAGSNQQVILLDYLNRVSLEMQRASKWEFLRSSPQKFMTQVGATNYWLGTPGQAPAGSVDTSLNLQDLRVIHRVFDRTNNRELGRIGEAPLVAKLEYPDSSFRMFRPAMWRQDPTTPQMLNIYPAPDNQNTYQPVPQPPICTTTQGGSLAARTYYVTATFVDSLGGEGTASTRATQITVPAGFLLVVNPPQPGVLTTSTGVQYSRYNVYASTNSSVGAQNLQTTIPLNVSAAFVEPTTGLLTSTAAAPGSSTLATLGGYLIEFRYDKQRIPLLPSTNTAEIIQIPDDYKDVVVSGVNARAYRFLRDHQMAMQEYQLYREGLTQLIRDMSNYNRNVENYLKPDPSAIGGYLPAVETLDLSSLANS